MFSHHLRNHIFILQVQCRLFSTIQVPLPSMKNLALEEIILTHQSGHIEGEE